MMFYALTYAWPGDPQVRGDEPSFNSARQAWAWLMRSRMQAEDQFLDWNVGEYSQTARYLDYAAGTEYFDKGRCEFGNPHEDWPLAGNGTGRIVGGTPGVGDSDSDCEVGSATAYEVVAR